jgi:hypothetical protein
MSDAIKILGYGSLLIASPFDEPETAFRACLTELLTEIYGQIPDWLKFEIGSRFEREGTFYRRFLCPSGSVDSRIQLRAEKPGGIERSIILRGTCSGSPFCSHIAAGIETEFDCDELHEIAT